MKDSEDEGCKEGIKLGCQAVLAVLALLLMGYWMMTEVQSRQRQKLERYLPVAPITASV